MKLSKMKSHKQVLAEDLKDPGFRAHWEKTALARAVALRIVAYRADHGLSQVQLAKKLGMKQPAVARLEVGDKNPTWDTLIRLSDKLGIEFVVDIVPPRRKGMAVQVKQAVVVQRGRTAQGRVVVAAR